MKIAMTVLFGAGACAAVAGVVWLGTEAPPAEDAATAAPQPMASADPARTTAADPPSSLWAWGNPGPAKANMTQTTDKKSLDILLAQALRASSPSADGDDPRQTLRKLAQQDPAVMQQLMQNYDKEFNSQTRQLIVSLLSGIEKPEVLAFSRRLAASSDMAQRRDGFNMLQNLSGDVPETHPVILQALAGDKSPDVIMLALAALKPPASAEDNSSPAQARDDAAIVAQLQELTGDADPDIRLQSILQLAQWDKADSSQQQWSRALADPSPQVRQAAVTAVAQSGTQSDAVKAALIGMANNQGESRDVRGNALQVLERFTLNQEETANVSQLRSQVPGL
ncbi:MAG TPA: hypothetical protein DHV59_15240 [Oxalobacteraceae bacterium]|nr:hypothetical protein [Oxalobacteraceae bacterium]